MTDLIESASQGAQTPMPVSASTKKDHGESVMEMHSRQSLYEIHGIIDPQRRRRTRWGRIARRAITRLLAIFKSARAAIAAELAARCAIEELAGMNDHMLRDLGITRSEIEDRARLPRMSIGMSDTSIVPDDLAQCRSDLLTVSSPERPEQQPRRLHAPSRQ